MNQPPQRRKRSARFTEIALEAGVSVSTVDRVLNERGSASSAARTRVIQAARKLDVPRILPETRHGVLHFDVLLSDYQTPFLKRLDQVVQRAIAPLGSHIAVHRVMLPFDDEYAYERAIVRPPYPRAGLIAMGSVTPRIRNALIQAIDRGETLATIVSAVPSLPPHHYAGIDNYQAGRTAGYWIGRLARRKGSVLILHGMNMVHAHEERTRGCADALREYFPTLHVQISPETYDNADRCYRYVNEALKEKKMPLVGVYDTGYGTPGIYPALRKAGAQGTVIWIGHEMLDDHRQYLTERSMDMVIDQNPDGQVASALQYLLHATGLSEQAPRPELREFGVYTLPNVRMQNYLD